MGLVVKGGELVTVLHSCVAVFVYLSCLENRSFFVHRFVQ